MWGYNAPPVGGGRSNPSPGKKFFAINIFRKNTPKYTILIVEPYICDNLSQFYPFFQF